MTATRDLSEEESESARRRRMYSASLGLMTVSRAERSERKLSPDDGMVAPGTMVSFSMRAMRPRWVEEVISSPRAALSSWDAVQRVSHMDTLFGLAGYVPAMPDCIFLFNSIYLYRSSSLFSSFSLS